ncbi:MAG TPA: zinc-binding alcohol dehydrogenase family protein [Solirubrobacteraceae bacterium]|nr:zinc-binding alcohol dehydrogenase family protein [Solirubrobacteraceae bacterium]
MKAAILEEYGGIPRYGDFDEPEGGDGVAVLPVLAAVLNPSDISRARGPGRFFVAPPPLPYVVGREGVALTADGRRMYFGATAGPFGSCAERCAVEERTLVELPGGLDEGVAASLGTSGTGWLALEWRASLKAGETVVILGATGVVGQIALQAARLLGAKRVVAVGRSTVRLERALELGADAAIEIGDPATLGARLSDACDGGFDVALDPLWGEPLAAALEAAKPGARIVQIGQSAGPIAPLASTAVRGKMLSLLGYTNFNRLVPAEERERAFRTMLDHAAAGRLVVDTERVPLAEAGAAWERQTRSPGAKLVIVP